MSSYKPQKEKKTLSESIKKEFIFFFKKIYWFNYTKFCYLKKTYFQKHRSDQNIISLITISRNRSKRLKKVLDKIETNTCNLKNIEILIFIDEDESETINYNDLVNIYKDKFKIKIYSNNLKKNTEKNNFLVRNSKGDLIFCVTDDMYLEKNWDVDINYEANKFNKNDAFCIWPKEIGLKYPHLHCNAPIISRSWFNKCGYYFHHDLFHYYADNWICDLSRECGNFLITKEYIWKHDHPDGKLELVDKTYLDLKNKSKIHNEKKIYEKLQEIRKETAEKLIF